MLLALIAAAGCSLAPYTARPLDQDAAIAEYTQRFARTDGFKCFGYLSPHSA